MKTMIKSFLLAASFCLFSTIMTAQNDAPAIYYAMDFMHVAPGMGDEYLAMEKAWKKLHAAAKKAGTIADWTLERVVSPAGSSMEYNYIARMKLVGEKQLAGYLAGENTPENWTALLTPSELELVMRTNQIRTWVKSEVWANVDRVMAEKMDHAKVNVFNYFSLQADVSNADYYKVERDIWMPVHAARVKDGTMKGWVMLNRMMPIGNVHPYPVATVDVYTDFEQLLTLPLADYFKKVHPGKSMAEIWDQTDAVTDKRYAEVRMEIDSLDE